MRTRRRAVEPRADGPAPAAAPTDWDGAGRWPEDDRPERAADPQVPLMPNPNSPNTGPS